VVENNIPMLDTQMEVILKKEKGFSIVVEGRNKEAA
jgi:hypothetical protein